MAKLGKDGTVISHWHHPIGNFQTSAMEFYAAVEVALKPREIPDYSVSRIDWREGGVLTARREYLRIQRGRLAFDLCAAPFGTGYFFSWWLAELPPSHALLWALLFCIFGMGLLAVMVLILGVVGLLWGIVFGVVGIFALGYLLREGHFGSEVEDVVLAIPVIGYLYEKIFKPSTYYRIDTTLMFQAVVNAAVQEVVEQVMSARGLRPLTELERKPVMREFYQR
ncbi:MAG TPA: hypothetical protein VHX60_13115 [Acidobacteriaceae bacterium]|jgi:hypothetical protein|nr:hypothetical protein [Acidobacteriaceae bacterium]